MHAPKYPASPPPVDGAFHFEAHSLDAPPQTIYFLVIPDRLRPVQPDCRAGRAVPPGTDAVIPGVLYPALMHGQIYYECV